jgi:hypothetical protein
MVRNQRATRVLLSTARITVFCCVPALLSGCGTAQTSGTVATRASFVWDVTTDIAGFPVEHYELSPCDEDRFVRETGDVGPTMDVMGEPAFPDVEALRRGVSTVLVATVSSVGIAFTVTPINLPDSYKTATGLTSPAAISWTWTPTQMSVDRVVWGDSGSTAIMGELGCYAPGATGALTPGTKLVVLAEPVDAAFGPYALFDGTHRIVDWFSVDASQRLHPRVGPLGLPSSAPFLVGLALDEVLVVLGGEP